MLLTLRDDQNGPPSGVRIFRLFSSMATALYVCNSRKSWPMSSKTGNSSGCLSMSPIHRDPEAHARLRDIALHQDALRQADPETWPLFMVVDEMMTARFADVVLVVARWAFKQGQEHCIPKSQDVSNVSLDEQTSGPQRGGA